MHKCMYLNSTINQYDEQNVLYIPYHKYYQYE